MARSGSGRELVSETLSIMNALRFVQSEGHVCTETCTRNGLSSDHPARPEYTSTAWALLERMTRQWAEYVATSQGSLLSRFT